MKYLLIAIVVALLATNHNLLFRREFPVPSIDGGAILISGASSGIGRATCGWLAEKDPKTTLYCGVRKEINALGHPFDLPNVTPVMLDITKQEHVDGVLEEIQSTGKPLIGLINNAGVAEMSIFEFAGVERLRTVLEVNVIGTYRLTQAALAMIRQSKGRIVIVGSLSGLLPALPLWSVYVASKHALEAMGDALRTEMAPLGVSVSMLEPGFIKTEMLKTETEAMQAILALNEAEEGTEERQIYPHLMDGKYLRELLELSKYPGRMDESCAAMEDAIFGKYPQTRYITSRAGPLPAWLAVKIFAYLPDRLADWTSRHCEIFIELQRARAALERLLGM